MGAVLAALGTMAAVAVVGWLLGRARVLGPGAEQVLARIVFTVAAPSLLLVTIAHADLYSLLSRVAVVTALSTTAVVVLALVVLRGVWHRPAGEAVVGALAASYVNAGNLGIPIAVYLLGSAVAVVPTLLFQLLVLAPLAFAVLESRPAPGAAAQGSPVLSRTPHVRKIASRTLRNPIIIGALVGVALALLPGQVPEPLLEPFRLIGAAAAPLALIALGMSLAVPPPREERRMTRELALVVGLRSVVHPLLAGLLGRALGLDGPALLTVVTMAALPTAQNVLVYALQYGRGQALARDAGLVTTAAAVPVMLAIAAALA